MSQPVEPRPPTRGRRHRPGRAGSAGPLVGAIEGLVDRELSSTARAFVTVAGFGLAVLLATLDHLTGFALSFDAFYVLLVVVMTVAGGYGEGRAEDGRRQRGRLTTAAPDPRTADLSLLRRPAPADVAGDPWRALRILSEFVEGFEAPAAIPPGISAFGSARTGPDDPMYDAARSFGAAAAQPGSR